MAAKEVKKATDNLTCPVCYQLFRNPKYLPCHHTYCEECLEQMRVKTKITCPECRKEAIVPPGGVNEFDNNFFVTRMMDDFVLHRKIEGEEEVKCDECTAEDPVEAYCPDCNSFLCSVCNAYHRRSTRSRSHDIVPLKELKAKKHAQPKAKIPICKDHDIELLFYCETCKQLLCLYCTVKDHVGHNHDTVKKMAIKPRKKMKEVTAPLEDMIKSLSKARDNVDKEGNNIRKLGDRVDKMIDQYYNGLLQKMMEQKEQLKQQLHNIMTQKEKAVTLQLETVELAQAEVMSMKELKDSVENSSDQEALLVQGQVIERMQQLVTKFKQLNTKPVQLATMDLVPTREPFPQFASLCSTATPDPYNCEVADLPGYTFVRKKTSFTVITRDDNGHRCSRGGSTVSVQLEGTQLENSVSIKDNQDGSYMANFSAQETGKVKVSVFVDEKEISQSPYFVAIRKMPSSVHAKPSKVIDNNGNMDEPWGIAFRKDGSWAAADWSNHCVYLFNKDDKLLRKIGTKGTDNGQFDRPKGIAFDSNGQFYVADYSNHRVQKFTIDGNYLLQFGGKGYGVGQLHHPLGLAVHTDKVFVANSDNKCVSVFTTNGKCLHIIQSDHLGSPLDVAVSGTNHLLVADSSHHCIHTFTMNGYYVGRFGSYGTGRGQLNYPYSVTTDLNGLIFVADTFNDRVVLFDKDGSCIHCFGSRGSGIGHFSCPYGIALSPNGSIYVSDHENKRIKIFSNY